MREFQTLQKVISQIMPEKTNLSLDKKGIHVFDFCMSFNEKYLNLPTTELQSTNGQAPERCKATI